MHKINDDYRIVPIDFVQQDPKNPKKHSAKDLEEKKLSLKTFGFTRPILVNKSNNIIIAGNGIHKAAKELGYEKVPAIFIDNLSLESSKAMNIGDNRLSENSEYDIDLFTESIQEINMAFPDFEWKAIGFESGEIELLLASFNNELQDDSGKTPEDLKDSEEEMGKSIKLTKNQRKMFDAELKSLKSRENNDNILEGDFIEILISNFKSIE